TFDREYEYETSYSYSPYSHDQQDVHYSTGAETTWGSGWEAKYWQICDPNKARAIAHSQIMPVQAKSSKWSSYLPHLPSSKPLLFLDLRWEILPQNPKCMVEVAMVYKGRDVVNQPHPVFALSNGKTVRWNKGDGTEYYDSNEEWLRKTSKNF